MIGAASTFPEGGKHECLVFSLIDTSIERRFGIFQIDNEQVREILLVHLQSNNDATASPPSVTRLAFYFHVMSCQNIEGYNVTQFMTN